MTTENIWDKFAISYNNVLSKWSVYLELVSKASIYLADSNFVLDQGCGTGIISLELAKQGKRIIGIDNNPYMLGEAQNRLLLANKESNPKLNAVFMEGNAEHLIFRDGLFDGIVANNVIFYVDNPNQMISETYRVLKEGGTFVVTGPKPNADIERLCSQLHEEFRQKEIYEELKEDIEHFLKCSFELKTTGIRNVYYPEEIAELLKKAGFSKDAEISDNIYLNQSFFVAVHK